MGEIRNIAFMSSDENIIDKRLSQLYGTAKIKNKNKTHSDIASTQTAILLT